MLGKDLKIGQEIWYRHSYHNEETNKLEREYGRGTVHSILGEGKNITADINTEKGNIYNLKPYNIYQDEFEMKMDRAADKFEDRMMDFTDKYVNQCSNLLKGLTGSLVPQNADMVMNDVKLRIQMIGSRIKERFTGNIDSFLEETKDLTMDSIQKELDGEDISQAAEEETGIGVAQAEDNSITEDLKDDGGSLESANKKEEEITLTADDLKFAPPQETLKL